MQPDLELVHIRKGESFAAWMHGYPFRTVRWHYHPEYEVHLVVDTSGTFYIGDFIGKFGPGQLILTGPNLPQNWISDIAPGESVPSPLHGGSVSGTFHGRCAGLHAGT